MWSLRLLFFTVFAAAVATGLLQASAREPHTAVVSYAETMWPANCRDSISYGGSPGSPKHYTTKRPNNACRDSSATTTTYISSVIASLPQNGSSVLESARSISDASIAYILSSINSTTTGADGTIEIQTVRFMPTLRTQDSDGVWRMTPRARIKSTLAALFGVFLFFAIKM